MVEAPGDFQEGRPISGSIKVLSAAPGIVGTGGDLMRLGMRAIGKLRSATGRGLRAAKDVLNAEVSPDMFRAALGTDRMSAIAMRNIELRDFDRKSTGLTEQKIEELFNTEINPRSIDLDEELELMADAITDVRAERQFLENKTTHRIEDTLGGTKTTQEEVDALNSLRRDDLADEIDELKFLAEERQLIAEDKLQRQFLEDQLGDTEFVGDPDFDTDLPFPPTESMKEIEVAIRRPPNAEAMDEFFRQAKKRFQIPAP